MEPYLRKPLVEVSGKALHKKFPFRSLIVRGDTPANADAADVDVVDLQVFSLKEALIPAFRSASLTVRGSLRDFTVLVQCHGRAHLAARRMMRPMRCHNGWRI